MESWIWMLVISYYGILGILPGNALMISLWNCAIFPSSKSDILAWVLSRSSKILKTSSKLSSLFIGELFLFTILFVATVLSGALFLCELSRASLVLILTEGFVWATDPLLPVLWVCCGIWTSSTFGSSFSSKRSHRSQKWLIDNLLEGFALSFEFLSSLEGEELVWLAVESSKSW